MREIKGNHTYNLNFREETWQKSQKSREGYVQYWSQKANSLSLQNTENHRNLENSVQTNQSTIVKLMKKEEQLQDLLRDK